MVSHFLVNIHTFDEGFCNAKTRNLQKCRFLTWKKNIRKDLRILGIQIRILVENAAVIDRGIPLDF